MTQNKTNSGMPHQRTDDLLADYLSDMFGEESVPASQVASEEIGQNLFVSSNIEDEEARLQQVEAEVSTTTQILDVFGGNRVNTMAPIASDMSLIPTIKLVKDFEDNSYRSQCEAQIVLMTFLFYLRKPLSPRVRQTFLDYSEQAIDDYYAAFWLAESAREESLQ